MRFSLTAVVACATGCLLPPAVATQKATNINPSFLHRVLAVESTKITEKKETAKTTTAARPKFLTPSPKDYDRHLSQLSTDDDWDMQPGCDQTFAESCLLVPNCVSCFGTLATEDIDWATVKAGTPCHDVVDFLYKKNVCTQFKTDSDALENFCTTFEACVVWEDYDNSKSRGEYNNSTNVDCSSLTSCHWEGFRPSYLGDGICHDALPGCYNSAICNYDGGDCCEDTCDSPSETYKACGTDGYACRDPSSKNCNSKLSSRCPDNSDTKNVPVCKYDEVVYKLNMFDSFGDGWDATKLTITDKGAPTDSPIFSGGLKDGFKGTEYVCLKTAPTCYEVRVSGGVWGNEVSWEVTPFREGSPAVAGGGTPMHCDFPVAGSSCTRTCTGSANKNPIDDEDYKDYKQMFECIEDKCIIQVGGCMADPTCIPCITEDTPEYCFSNTNFNAIVTCGLCQCRDDMADTDFCDTKAVHTTPGVAPAAAIDEPGHARECTPQETMKGSNSVIAFSECTDFDQVKVMVTNFDQDNFGMLDVFEKCAHSYKNEPMHGGYHALGCMKILKDAIDKPNNGDSNNAPTEAISTLAQLLYTNGENFCDCAKQASDSCPSCASFLNFKTLLQESLDACIALDEIDCDAWNEFYKPCETNLKETFISVDFRNEAQCDYVKDNCGGAGTFPAFRRLDCGREISKSAWEFHEQFAASCIGDAKPVSTPYPTPAPVSVFPPGTPATPEPTVEYVPLDDDIFTPESSSSGDTKKKRSHFWRNIFILGILGGAGYYVYKKRQDSFTFIRYRRAPRNFGGDGDGIGFAGGGFDLSSSTNFEPPTLPPPPSAMQQQPPQQYP